MEITDGTTPPIWAIAASRELLSALPNIPAKPTAPAIAGLRTFVAKPGTRLHLWQFTARPRRKPPFRNRQPL